MIESIILLTGILFLVSFVAFGEWLNDKYKFIDMEDDQV